MRDEMEKYAEWRSMDCVSVYPHERKTQHRQGGLPMSSFFSSFFIFHVFLFFFFFFHFLHFFKFFFVNFFVFFVVKSTFF